MPGPAGPRYVPGLPTASTDITVPKGTRLTLAHLRALLAQADSIHLSPGAVVTPATSIGGKLTGLKVEGDIRPAANDPLTGQ
jgi:hypothetical protein